MADATRFGVSMNKDLLKSFDRLIKETGYRNRSEAIRDLIRERLVQKEWQLTNEETVGSITLVYSHDVHELTEALTALQHEYHKHVLSTMHIHLDKHNCLEVLVVKGRGNVIKKIADRLLSTRGVKHGKLTTTTTGRKIT
ncbi:nickel-responsive transcriptional regulator NikR [candidate division WOR-3 bacterium]|nr:nickel-responsive transcriptional regulator NikR [candidate division WOR-3 bacterium]